MQSSRLFGAGQHCESFGAGWSSQSLCGDAKVKDDRGSVAPLGIGLAALSLATILTFASAGSLFVLQRRITTLAEAAALSSASSGGSVQDFLSAAAPLPFQQLVITKEAKLDGLTVEVKLCANWQSPLRVIGVPLARQICGYGAAR